MSSRNYLRCVYANKVTLSGVVLAASGLAKIIGVDEQLSDVELSSAIIAIGVGAAYLTEFGKSTFNVYCLATQNIKERGVIEDRFKERFERYYCNRVGMRLAAQDAGIDVKFSKYVNK